MTLKPPFWYYGNKTHAAPTIWKLLGDVGGYIEPFAGSLGALLARPADHQGGYETVNDLDGWLINTWRSIRLSPGKVADLCDVPLCDSDYRARLLWLQKRRDPDLRLWLEADPEQHDPKAAGYWLYVMACSLGNPWAKGTWDAEGDHLKRVGQTGVIGRNPMHLGAGRGIWRPTHQGRLHDYMGQLATRLKNTRITCGTWRRPLVAAALRTTTGGRPIGILLDPPYTTSGDLYAEHHDHAQISHQAREWCLSAPSHLKIVLCGYDTDHDQLLDHGWTKHHGKTSGGYKKTRQQENLWATPSCA